MRVSTGGDSLPPQLLVRLKYKRIMTYQEFKTKFSSVLNKYTRSEIKRMKKYTHDGARAYMWSMAFTDEGVAIPVPIYKFLDGSFKSTPE